MCATTPALNVFKRLSKRLRLLALLSLFLLPSAAHAQRFLLPGALGSEQRGSVTVRYGGERFSYTPGLGWFGPGTDTDSDTGSDVEIAAGLSAPTLEGTRVYLESDVLDALGVTLPRLRGVRSSGGGTVRLVFDLEIGAENLGAEDLDAEAFLETLRGSGERGRQEALVLELPPLLLPQGLPDRLQGLSLGAYAAANGTRLELRGPAFSYEVFPLREPTRLVVDITANISAEVLSNAPRVVDIAANEGAADEGSTDGPNPERGDAATDLRERFFMELRPETPEAARTLAPGVTLRHLRHITVAGHSRVDVVEIAPAGGHFKIVAGTEARPLSELAAGALVGINASYFNTADGQTIGLLKQAGEIRSLPSRNRAAIGFGFGRVLVGRPRAALRFELGGLPFELGENDERVTLYTTPGALVGSPRQGALVVRRGRVLENKVGPRAVPEEGYVLSYAPELRELARLNAGERLELGPQLSPRAFGFTPEAVEAGPLLVANGRPAYRPELEAFDTEDPESNVNRRTTRAAVGVKEDGTVLFVTATELTAAELVPLFLGLGAESALQMDSGGSSTLVAGGEVVNRPAFSQRPVATAIVFSPTESALRETP